MATQQDAQIIMENLLGTYDLRDLVPYAMSLIVDGFTDPDIVLIKLQEQPRFKTRFAANEQRIAKGLPPLSPGEYITYERQVRQLFRSANLPPGFYDSNEDIAGFIANDKSLAELNAQVVDGFSRVQTAPREVRQAFGVYFGADGDSALAAIFLDDKAALPVLERMVASAEIGGFGRRAGFDFNAEQAQELAGYTRSQAETRQRIGQLSNLRSLTEETVSESEDITGFQAGQAIFAEDASQQERLRRRREARAAQFAGLGGAVVTQTGVTGLGEAE